MAGVGVSSGWLVPPEFLGGIFDLFLEVRQSYNKAMEALGEPRIARFIKVGS